MNKEEMLQLMDMKEIKKRLKNPLLYKMESLKSNFLDSEKNHKGSEDIIKYNTEKLCWLNKVETEINEMFLREFPDEPTDEDINKFKKECN